MRTPGGFLTLLPRLGHGTPRAIRHCHACEREKEKEQEQLCYFEKIKAYKVRGNWSLKHAVIMP